MQEVEIVCAAIDKLSRQLRRESDLDYLNALLSVAPTDRVLPAPAVGLLEIETTESIRLSSTRFFRSLDAVGTTGEVSLSTARPEQIHPCRMVEAQPVLKDGSVKGLIITLDGEWSQMPKQAWVSLFLDGDPIWMWLFRSAVVTSAGRRLVTQSAFTLEGTGVSAWTSTARLLGRLAERLLTVQIDSAAVSGSQVTIELTFKESPPASSPFTNCVVRANVVPVLNSLPARYPSFERVGAALAGQMNRRVHPLTPDSLGPDWNAWQVTRVGAARDAALSLTAQGPSPGYRIALTPSERNGVSGSSTVLKRNPSVILSETSADMLELADHRLEVEFLATRGASVNGVPRETKFRLVEASGMPLRQRVDAELVTTLIGGSDGLLEVEDIATIQAVSPRPGERTVGEAVTALTSEFDGMLQISEPTDFVRMASGADAPELTIRVTVSPRYTTRLEKNALLGSFQEAVERYLAGNGIGPITILENS